MAEIFAEAKQPTFKQPIVENAPYNRKEATDLTGFSLSTLIRAEERGKLKPRRQGRRVYYMGADILSWLNAEEGGVR
jgi:hypothetical protein